MLGALTVAWVVASVQLARADGGTAPAHPSEQCIADHVAGQALRLEGRFVAAAQKLRQCLHPSCSPVLREDCAALLRAVEAETPTLVFAARAQGRDLIDVTVRLGGRVLTTRLDGRAVPLDAGPAELTFETEHMAPVTQAIVVRAGEKNRLVTASLGGGKPAEPPSTRTAPVQGAAQPPEALAEPRPPARVGPWDYALFGASLALAGGGMTLGLIANDDFDEASSACGEDGCPDWRTDAIQRKARAADSLFVLSAATLVFATLHIALRRPRAKKAHVLLGPTHVGGRISF